MFGFRRRIYLDYASATPVCGEAARAVARAAELFANPGSLHADGVQAAHSLQHSRERMARHLECKPREIVFTSGLTEANNLGIVGAARALERARRTLAGTHWIVSSIEHSSVLECFLEVERMGGAISYVEPKQNGLIEPEAVKRLLKPETVFISIGWGNNEIGTIQPLSAIARVVRTYEKEHKTNIIFHSDAGQAPLYHSPHVHTLGVDLLALGSGKLYGPRGIGALYVSNHVVLATVLFGGGQERGLRAGTEDVALAAGFAEALDYVARNRAAEGGRLGKLRDDFARKIVAHIPHVIINGSTSLTTGGNLKHTLSHLLNISVPGEKSGEYLALQLDHEGVSVSTKSACDEGNKSSHVVAALGGPAWRAENTLRFSFGVGTRRKHLQRTAEILARLVHPSA
jgi:cysteine desulfurase